MKFNYLKTASLLVFAAAAFSCSKSSNNNNNNQTSCDIIYSEAGGLQADGAVQYMAGVTGPNHTQIGSISYQDSAGITTVQNPTIPWSKTVNLKQGSAVTIKALAVANLGDTVNVSAFADGSQGGTSCP